MNKEDNKLLCKEYFTEINELIRLRKLSFTSKEMALYCKTSRQTISEFENMKVFNFALMYRYCAMFGKNIMVI
jgi:DNA-binding XRE family transcriptional regulator